MPSALVRCRSAALRLCIACVAVTAVFFATARDAAADPAKQGASTAGVLAEESGRPTPGVNAPKVEHKASAHHATAKSKPKATAKKAHAKHGATPVKAKQSAPKHVAPPKPAAPPVKKTTATRA